MPRKSIEERRQYSKTWREKNKERLADKNKTWYEENKEHRREYQLLKKYGLNIDDFDRMLDEQGHCCKICNTHISQLNKPLYVDHCHTTNKVRGLLCHTCNSCIGHAKDDIEILKSAIKYLEDNR